MRIRNTLILAAAAACIAALAIPAAAATRPAPPKAALWGDNDAGNQYLLFKIQGRRIVDIDGGILMNCGADNSAFSFGRGTVDERIVLRGRGSRRHWEASLRISEDDVGRQGVVDVGINFTGRKRARALITVQTNDGQCSGSLALDPKTG